MKKHLLLVFLSACYSVHVFAQCANPTATFNYYSSGGGHYSFVDLAATSTQGHPNQMSGFQTYEWTYLNTSFSPTTYQFGYLSIADHTFPAGTNHVCEYIEDQNGCHYGPYCVDITVGGNTCPTIVYYLANTISSNGAGYTFTDASTGLNGSQTYSWKVDGASVAGTGSSITKTFSTSGQHQVCMTIYDYGCTYGPFCFNYDVQICNGIPDFAPTGSSPTYTFTNSSTGMSGSATYRWNIDGADVGTGASVNHTFTNGDHNICLYIQDGGCAYNACLPYHQGSCPNVVVDFSINSPDGYNFTYANISSGTNGSQTYAWSLDGIAQGSAASSISTTYTTSGNHEVCLTVNDYSCTYSLCGNALACIPPDGGMAYNALHSPVILMRDSLVSNAAITSHSWTINGTFISHDSVLTYTFAPGTTYHICDTFKLLNACEYVNCEDYLAPPAVVNSVSEPKNELFAIQVFPNPSVSGMVTVSIQNTVALKIEVFNNIGQEVYQQIPERIELVPLDLSSLPVGTYMVRVKAKEGIANIRWVKM